MKAEPDNCGLRIAGCGLVPCREDDTGQVLTEIVIAPDGDVRSKTGSFLVDRVAGRLVEEVFRAHGTDLPIDYEHQTVGGRYASSTGLAPAAGWIKAIHYEPGRGLVASVEWTERALGMIRTKEYRYLSPVLMIRKEDKRVAEIHSVALTNKPAIPCMEALAASQRFLKLENRTMPDETGTTEGTADQAVSESEQLLIALGRLIEKYGLTVEASAGPLAVVEALLAKDGGGKKEDEGGGEAVASKAVLTALQLKEDATEAELVVAINTLAKGKESSAATVARLEAVETELSERKADELLGPHIEAGRINPNDAEDVKVCKALAMSDAAAFKHHMERRQPNPPPGQTTAPGRPASGGRETMMVNAVREFEGDPKLGRLSSKAAFVDGTLREHKLAPLTDDERKKISA